MTIYVDHTHLGRHVTGLERITLELFSKAALAPLAVKPVDSRGTAGMMAAQTLGLPARLAASKAALLLCPGFPPSPPLWPFRARVLPYIHDDFLLTRAADLNIRAKLYMATPFAIAVRHYPRFLANSRDTQRRLAQHIRPDAEITLYRPPVRNVFDLQSDTRAARDPVPAPLRLVALGTVEPRKNFLAAAQIVGRLRRLGFKDASLDLVGRAGWGDDWAALERMPGVTLHGYQPADAVTRILDKADLFICTSHDEGLGLPLLEAQYAGLPVAAPDAPVFREVLDASGIYIDPSDPGAAAARITAALKEPAWRARHAGAAAANLARWNAQAAQDHGHVIELIARLAGGAATSAARRSDVAAL